MNPAKIILKVRLILEDKGEILMLKQTSKNGGKYTLVGGTVEKGEFAIEALIRESKEETGITLQKRNLKLVHTLHKKRVKDTRIILYFRATKWKGDIEARETDKFKKVSWFPKNELPKNTSATVRHVLGRMADGKVYSEYPNAATHYQNIS